MQIEFPKVYVSNNFTLPLKVLLAIIKKAPFSFKTNLYPVPDLKQPFLGYMLLLQLKVKLDPAIPAFGRKKL